MPRKLDVFRRKRQLVFGLWLDLWSVWSLKCECEGKWVKNIFPAHKALICRNLEIDVSWIDPLMLNEFDTKSLEISSRDQNSQEHPVCETADPPSSAVSSCQHLWQRRPEPRTVPLRPPASGKLSWPLGWGSSLAPGLHRCRTTAQSSAPAVRERERQSEAED